MLTGFALRAEVRASAGSNKFRASQAHPNSILRGSAHLGDNLIGLGRQERDSALGKIRLAARADRVAETACDLLRYSHHGFPTSDKPPRWTEKVFPDESMFFGAEARSVLDVEVFHLKRVFFDEFPSRFDIVAHKRSEQVVGGGGVIKLHLL